MTDLQTVNLVLDIAVKTVFLIIFAVTIYVLKSMDDLLKSAERSAESLEHTAENIERIVSFAKMLPFVGPRKGGKDE